jgi:type IV secretory pathway TrbD component
MLAHATRPEDRPKALTADAAANQRGGSDDAAAATALAFIRYLDVVLVVASTPFVLLAGLPAAGFAIGALTWIATRFGVGVLEQRAWGARDMRVRTALHLASILGRVWFVALAVILARFAIGTSDGIAAAVVVLAAYTVELVTKITLRRSITAGLRRPS